MNRSMTLKASGFSGGTSTSGRFRHAILTQTSPVTGGSQKNGCLHGQTNQPCFWSASSRPLPFWELLERTLKAESGISKRIMEARKLAGRFWPARIFPVPLTVVTSLSTNRALDPPWEIGTVPFWDATATQRLNRQLPRSAGLTLTSRARVTSPGPTVRTCSSSQ